ncbi:MAG: MarR family winged helix-turn-helix transcriptional regulator [Variovorax sp.]
MSRVTPDAAALEPAPPDRVSFLAHAVDARIASIGNRHFRAHGLNHFSARILVLLLAHEALRTGELVDLMLLPQSTISSQLQVLHKKALVRRRRSRQDNRSVVVTLTEAGRELALDCDRLSVLVHQATLSDMGKREREAGLNFLRKVQARLATLEGLALVPFHNPGQLQKLAGSNAAKVGKNHASASATALTRGRKNVLSVPSFKKRKK